MNKLLFILSFATLLFTSCSTDNDDNESVVGEWRLTSYNIASEFDINSDGVFSTNILDEIECANNETLIFESNGVMSSNATFNPTIDIILLDEITNEYTFNVVCDSEGIISFASEYSQNGEIISYSNKEASIQGNQLYVVFESAIKVLSKDLLQVVSTEDLILTYTKQ